MEGRWCPVLGMERLGYRTGEAEKQSVRHFVDMRIWCVVLLSVQMEGPCCLTADNGIVFLELRRIGNALEARLFFISTEYHATVHFGWSAQSRLH